MKEYYAKNTVTGGYLTGGSDGYETYYYLTDNIQYADTQEKEIWEYIINEEAVPTGEYEIIEKKA